MDRNGPRQQQAERDGKEDGGPSGRSVWLARPKVLAAFIVLILVVVTLLLIQMAGMDDRYNVDIQRVANTEAERHAIEVAESLETTVLLDVSRYGLWREDPSNTPPEDLNVYVWPYVIDGGSIEYFQWRVDAQRDLFSNDRAELEYSAEGVGFSNLTLYIWPGAEQYNLRSEDRTIDYHGGHLYLAPPLKIDNESSLHLDSGFLVFQQLTYNEFYDGLTGYSGTVKQFIVLDDEGSVLLIFSGRDMGIA